MVFPYLSNYSACCISANYNIPLCSRCARPSSPAHGLEIRAVLLITPGCGRQPCEIVHLPSGAWCLTFAAWRDLHQSDIFQCNCLIIGTKHRHGNKQPFASRQVAASMWWRSVRAARQLLPCVRVLLLGPVSALWDYACSSWLDTQPKFSPENQTSRIPWFLSCHLLAASFQEDSTTSKSVMDHYGQQGHWKCVDLQVNMWSGDEGDCAITSNDWQWHLSFRTSVCAFLTMRMGVT